MAVTRWTLPSTLVIRCSWYTAPRMAVRMERMVKNVRIVAVSRSEVFGEETSGWRKHSIGYLIWVDDVHAEALAQ